MNKVNFYYSLLILIVLLSACGSGLPAHIAVQFATPSPTPFLPGTNQVATIADQAGNLEDPDSFSSLSQISDIGKNPNSEVWSPFPAPTLLSDVTIPAAFPAINLPEGQVNILILGSDQRPDDMGFRTDVILVLSLNPETGSANLISFPRDLYVYQPGYRMDRINGAQARGAAELSFLTFEYNFGFRPDHYVMVNFAGFSKIIDSLGGIEVDAGQTLSDHRDGIGAYTVNAGPTLMDAETALWYVRSRGTSNDFDRARRQQEVLSALFNEAISLDLFRNAADIYQAYKETVQTDLGFGDILQLLPLASQIYSGDSIGKYSIGPNEVIPWITSSNAQVLLPERESVHAMLLEALQHK